MERLTSAEFAEIVADYGLEPWGEEWQQTAFLASTMVVTKSGQSVKDYKALIPRRFPDALNSGSENIDPESFFRKLTSGFGGQNHD